MFNACEQILLNDDNEIYLKNTMISRPLCILPLARIIDCTALVEISPGNPLSISISWQYMIIQLRETPCTNILMTAQLLGMNCLYGTKQASVRGILVIPRIDTVFTAKFISWWTGSLAVQQRKCQGSASWVFYAAYTTDKWEKDHDLINGGVFCVSPVMKTKQNVTLRLHWFTYY